jgi:hypothetical protein
MLAGLSALAGHVHHDDIFRCDHFPHPVKGKCIVPLVKLGMGLSGTLDNGLVVTEEVTKVT